ncbi:MAG: fibronectin type III domain-containing protein [Treponema sp.]|uniref:fibronectin type III domain-containing protein n=1 Tax=Treponema sp. TaxID=166 RepID=UPI003FA2980F
MVDKYFVMICAGLLALCLFPAAAQEQAGVHGETATPEQNTETVAEVKLPVNEKKNYFLQETDEGITLVQRLSWEAIDDIFGFEFQLEKFDKKTNVWNIIDQDIVKINYKDVSLPPGSYRYRVQIINLLEQKEEMSAYRNFDIRLAYQPEIAAISPGVINFDELESQTLTATGKNLHEDTVFTLTDELTGTVLQGTIVQVNEAGTNAVIGVELLRANPGTYTFAAVDPSDLRAAKRGIVFRFQKPIDVFISGNYVFNGFIGNKVLKQYFASDIAPLAGGIRFTVAPIKRFYGNFGINLTGSGTYFKHKADGYTVSTGLLFTNLNAVYFYPIIRRRLVLDVHAGVGSIFMFGPLFTYHTKEVLTSDKTWYWGLTFNAGTALYIYLYKRLYVEVNLDHIVPFRGGNGYPAYIIQPQVGIGWEF